MHVLSLAVTAAICTGTRAILLAVIVADVSRIVIVRSDGRNAERDDFLPHPVATALLLVALTVLSFRLLRSSSVLPSQKPNSTSDGPQPAALCIKRKGGNFRDNSNPILTLIGTMSFPSPQIQRRHETACSIGQLAM